MEVGDAACWQLENTTGNGGVLPVNWYDVLADWIRKNRKCKNRVNISTVNGWVTILCNHINWKIDVNRDSIYKSQMIDKFMWNVNLNSIYMRMIDDLQTLYDQVIMSRCYWPIQIHCTKFIIPVTKTFISLLCFGTASFIRVNYFWQEIQWIIWILLYMDYGSQGAIYYSLLLSIKMGAAGFIFFCK